MAARSPEGAAARVAAGRKKLEEYRLKKNAIQSVTSISPELNRNENTFTNDEINFNSHPNPKDNVKQYQENDGKSNSDTFHQESPEISSPDYLFRQVNSPSVVNFFDELSSHEKKNNTLPESVPLAGVLFTNQNGSNTYTNGDQHALSNVQHLSQELPTTAYNENPPLNKNEKQPEIHNDSSENEESADEAISTSEAIRLQQQLQFHMQTVEFLVTEKSELSSKINELETVITNMKNQNEDVIGRLNISRHRASCLEMEYSNLKEKNETINERLSQALQDNSKYQNLELTYVGQCNDLKEELQETKSLIDNKISENAELKKRLDEMTFQLTSAELRFQQLNQGAPQSVDNQALIEQNHELKQQIANLNHQLGMIDSEKNQSNAQYQQYVQQLNSQLESMSQKHEELILENENLINRESNLIQQMEALEKQLQSTIHVIPDTKTKDKTDNEAQLNASLKELEEKNMFLQGELQNKEVSFQTACQKIVEEQNRIEELENTIQHLQSERPDVNKLNAANESDRIAAQKATVQNSKLKSEVDNLQEAYKKMTDSKLELVELLQAEKNLTRTLTLTLADNEEKLKNTHSKLVAKDEEMLRLQAESSELEKEALKHAQIVDRLNHYEAQNQSSDLLQNELELSRNRLKTISEENRKLVDILQKHNISLDDSILENVDNLNQREDLVLVNNEDTLNEVENLVIQNGIGDIHNMKPENCMHIPATEAMKKLQDRFTKLMDDVADLSDDKQRLEHLVVQLQGETETIGEYIVLYQRQRNILKQREYEKDIQLNLLSKERQHMKDQLDRLNGLVEEFLKEPNSTQSPVAHKDESSNEKRIITADKIIKLLDEIKSNHLVESGGSSNQIENFHPCPWCSGKLITI